MGEQSATPDQAVAQLAARQHGVVSWRQLLDRGLGRKAVDNRLRRGHLHRLHRGVYAVGHVAPSEERRWMAAVLACGEGAVLSHGSAAALWGLLRPISGPVDVSVPTSAGRRGRQGVRVHRCASLASPALALRDGDPRGGRDGNLATKRNGIPVTSVSRTISDLRSDVPPRLVRRAIRQAEIAGVRVDGIETDRTRSDLERDFLRLCRRHGLPLPQVNVTMGRWTVDFLWEEKMLAVEADSWAYHRGSAAFEDDHARDLDLRRRGYDIRRFSERQVRSEPGRVAADLAEALSPAH